MNNYISNKRKIEKVSSIMGIAFWIINFVFLEVSINILFKIILANRSEWFEKAATMEVENDRFFINRNSCLRYICTY